MLGWREFINWKAGHYLWKTYKVVCEEVLYVGSALRQLDAQPMRLHIVMTKTTPTDRVMPRDLDPYNKKKGERSWINHTRQVCSGYSFICVPLYDTLGSGAVGCIIEHSELEQLHPAFEGPRRKKRTERKISRIG